MNAQAAMFSPADLAYLNEQLKQAHDLAGDDPTIRQRIEFFERGWRLAEHYIREYGLINQLQAAPTPAAAADIARRLLAAVQARRAYWAKFREIPRFPSYEEPCEDYRFFLEALKWYADWESNHQATLSLVAARIASESPQTLDQLLADFRPPTPTKPLLPP